MTTQPDWDALGRYVSGESPPAEAEAIRRWLEEDPSRRSVLQGLDDVLGHVQFTSPKELDVEAALKRVTDRFKEHPLHATPGRLSPAQEQRRIGWRTIGLRVAAVVTLVVGATLVWQATQNGTNVEDVNSPRTFATAAGQTDSIQLADGSRVLLGPGSRLTVANGYGAGTREVELQGEALFDVLHDDARPFTVRTGGALVEDLGTTFTVRSDDAGAVRVVVSSGSVRLRSAASANGITLHAGERGELSADGVASTETATLDSDLAWTRGQLVFDGAPLSVVSAELRRWYGVELRVDSMFAQARVTTGTFNNQESVQQVLDVIAAVLGATVDRRGDTVYLRASSPRAP
jgi:transmembrane sensor